MSEQQPDKEYIQELADYIKESVLQGAHIEDLREQLRQAGHDIDAIDEAIIQA